MSAAKPFVHHNIKVRPRSAAPTSGYYADQVSSAYGYPKSVSPAGLVVGIVELGGQFYPSDLQTFCQTRGLPVPPVTVVPVNGATISPDPNGADVEVMLDVETIAGAFPGCAQRIYFGDNTEAGFIAAVQQAVQECDVVSISWGAPEDQWSASGMQQMNAVMAGKPVCVASGDSGSSDGEKGKHADFPASAPNAIAVGGTSIPAGSNGLPNVSAETSWNASGGGVSAVFSKPSYQSGESLSGSMRGSPDCAALADPNTPYNVFANGQWMQVGGTSAAAPMIAALFGLLKAQVAKLPDDVHSLLYSSGSCRDITGASNGAYPSGSGYDLVTGNGEPIYAKMLSGIAGASPPPSPPPSPPVPPSPPLPPPAPVPVPAPSPVSTIMYIIDSAFAQAIQNAAGNALEVLILQTVQRCVDTELPPLLSAAEGALWQFTLSRIQAKFNSEPWMKLAADSVFKKVRAGLGKRALPSGTLLSLLQSLLQDAPEIISIVEQITQWAKGGDVAA